jgi:hypothetical protein
MESDAPLPVAARAASSASLGGPRDALPRRPRVIGEVSWQAPEGLGYREWVLEGRRIGLIARASPWWIGDWLLYGSAEWGEMYAAAARITGYDPKSLRNMRYVASRLDHSLRRPELTWSHHALVAGLDSVRLRHWLERASRERLSVADLRLELRADRRRALAGTRRSAPGAAPSGRTVRCPNCGDRVRVPDATGPA